MIFPLTEKTHLMSPLPVQGSFWIWAQPMGDEVTFLRHLSLAKPMPQTDPFSKLWIVIVMKFWWNHFYARQIIVQYNWQKYWFCHVSNVTWVSNKDGCLLLLLIGTWHVIEIWYKVSSTHPMYFWYWRRFHTKSSVKRTRHAWYDGNKYVWTWTITLDWKFVRWLDLLFRKSCNLTILNSINHIKPWWVMNSFTIVVNYDCHFIVMISLLGLESQQY